MQTINNKILGIVMIVAGGVIGWLGWEEKQSIGSGLKSAFSGSPSDKAIYMLVAAAILIALGLFLVARSRGK